jgi:hypothetical protein
VHESDATFVDRTRGEAHAAAVNDPRSVAPLIVWHPDDIELVDWLASGEPGPMPLATSSVAAALLKLLGESD